MGVACVNPEGSTEPCKKKGCSQRTCRLCASHIGNADNKIRCKDHLEKECKKRGRQEGDEDKNKEVKKFKKSKKSKSKKAASESAAALAELDSTSASD